MKSNKMMVFVAGLALAVGTFLVNPSAEALNVTTKKPAIVSLSPTAHYTFILGLDGNIWYTLSSSVGSIPAKTGNSNNPFDLNGASFLAGGFVTTGNAFCNTGTVVSSLSAVTGTCSQNWVKFPGAANFNDSPTALLFGPIAATTSSAAVIAANAGNTPRTIFPFLPGSTAILINILAPGLDNNIWYTLFDGTGNSGTTTSIAGSTAFGASTAGTGGGGIAAGDPFATAGESSDTGFVSTATMATGCGNATPTRTCSGIWAPYP